MYLNKVMGMNDDVTMALCIKVHKSGEKGID